MVRQVFTGIEQFDFQIIRFTSLLKDSYPQVTEDLASIHQVQDTEGWYSWWASRAQTYEKKGQLELAASYYRAALFYLADSDPRKDLAYQKFICCFYSYHSDWQELRHQVPYRQGFLPALLLPNPQAKRTLLVFGGFDSYLEELASWFQLLRQELPSHNILIFDGPGQGHVPRQGIYFQANYEEAVAAVLDYFDLKAVDAIGISWGGSFVLRAAAFENRIKRLIAFDIFYDAMDTLRLHSTRLEFATLQLLLALRQKRWINRIIQQKATESINFQWFLDNGCSVTGEETAYDFLKNIQHHRIKAILPLVRQDCLLMAGSQDMYVPLTRLQDIEEGLSSAHSIQSTVFTPETSGELHCQINDIPLALETIRDYLQKRV